MPDHDTVMPDSDFFARIEPGQRKANKRHIMSSALACFEELGLEATTIEQIRERADSSIGSIYHHFGNKEGLVATLYLAALDDQLALIQPRMTNATDPRQAVEAMVKSYLEWVTAQPTLARFMFQARLSVSKGPHQEALQERNKSRFGALLTLLKDAVKSGEVLALPPETYASLLVGPSENYCRAWLSGRVKTRPADNARVFAEAAWRSIASTAG